MEEKELTFADIIDVFFRRRNIFLFNFFAFAFIGLLLAFVIPRKYTSSFTLLPPVMVDLPGREIWTAIIKVSIEAGGLYNESRPSAFIKDFLTSRKVCYAVIDSLNLVEVFRARNKEDAYKILSKCMKTKIKESGILTVKVVTKDPELSFKIASALLTEMHHAIRDALETLGRGASRFLEYKLQEVTAKLHEAEDSLEAFQRRHKTVALSTELNRIIQKVIDLKSEYFSAKIQLDMLKKYAPSQSATIRELEAKVQTLEKKLHDMESKGGESLFGPGFAAPLLEFPEISLQYAHLETEVGVYRSLYRFVKEAYERAKLYEVQQTPLIEVLDHPIIPMEGEPRKLIVIGACTILGLFLGIVSVFLSNYMEYFLFEDPKGKRLFNDLHATFLYRLLTK